jgi:hypothetical protein
MGKGHNRLGNGLGCTKEHMFLQVDLQSIDPDLAGELLRDLFFDQKHRQIDGYFYRELGCYSTFELKKGILDAGKAPVQHLVPNGIEDDEKFSYSRFVHFETGIEMRYYWDGDGELVFIFPDQTVLANTDCKKTHVWKKYKNWQDFLHGQCGE